MATKRSTFQKRQRETDLKDKALAKQRRRADKRARKADGPIERGPDGLPIQAADEGDENPTNDGASASPPPPPPPAPAFQQRPPRPGPGPRGMSPGPRTPAPAPAPAPAPPPPAPAAPKGPAPMYVPSKHITNRPKTATSSTTANSGASDPTKPR